MATAETTETGIASLEDFCSKYFYDDHSTAILHEFLDDTRGSFNETLAKPASSSGKYHPSFDRGKDGTLNHSKAVVQIAEDLMRADRNERWVKKYHDSVIFACAIHDLSKYGMFSTSPNTCFEHPEIIAKEVKIFTKSLWYKNHKHLPGFNKIHFGKVISAVARHMGKWTTSKYSTVVLKAPRTKFDYIVHMADYMASRVYISKTVLKGK